MIEKLGPKGRAATISMDLVTHNQGKSISPIYEKVRSPGHRNNTRHHEKCQNAFYTILFVYLTTIVFIGMRDS